MNGKVTYIYTLIDPRDNQPRYVGKTINLHRRYRVHLQKALKTHVSHWIMQLKRQGITPEMVIIESVPPDQDWAERERFWIAEYQRRGYQLTNSTSGGETTDGVVMGPEARAKISAANKGRKFSPEVCQKFSELRRGRKHTEESRRKIAEAHIGIKPSPETRQKLSAWQKGSKLSPERCAKISEGLRGKKFTPERSARQSAHFKGIARTVGERCGSAKLTTEQVREIRARVKAGEKRMDLAREYGITHNAIHKIVHYLSWKSVE